MPRRGKRGHPGVRPCGLAMTWWSGACASVSHLLSSWHFPDANGIGGPSGRPAPTHKRYVSGVVGDGVLDVPPPQWGRFSRCRLASAGDRGSPLRLGLMKWATLVFPFPVTASTNVSRRKPLTVLADFVGGFLWNIRGLTVKNQYAMIFLSESTVREQFSSERSVCYENPRAHHTA